MSHTRQFLTFVFAVIVHLAPAIAADQSIAIHGDQGADPSAVATFVTKFEGELHTLDITVEDASVELDVITESPTNGLWQIETTRSDGAKFRLADASAHQNHASSFKFRQKSKGGAGGGSGGGSKTYEAISQQIQIFASYPGEPEKEAPRPTQQGDEYYGIVLPDQPEKPVRIRLVYNRSAYDSFDPSSIQLAIANGLKIVNRPADQGVAEIAAELQPGSEVTFDVVHDSGSVPVINEPLPIMLTLTEQSGAIHEDKVNLLPVEIVADTNRDGLVNLSDKSGKDQWSSQHGAIYSVNFDNDNHGAGAGFDTMPDAITWWDIDGVPKHENWTIENKADVADIAPLHVTIPNLPDGSRVFLTAGHLEQIHAVHVFGKVEASAQAIWGGILTEGRPWADADTERLDIEISGWLSPVPSASAKPVKGTYNFGVEGIAFRGMKIPNGTLAGRFGGIVEIGLEIQLPGEQSRMPCGKVKMKVAPFLLTSNDRPTDSVFVLEMVGGLADKGNDPAHPKPVMPLAKMIDKGTPNHPNKWIQDHAEIGYTQRPGGPLTKMTFVCPYEAQLATWPSTELFSVDKGIFALGKNLNGDGGDFGGNIELTHPQDNYPLGRVVAGSAMSASLRAFLEAQELQTPVVSNIAYTEIQHIDEVLSPGPNNTTYVPGPAEAILLLQEKFDNEGKQVRGVLFSPDTVQPTVAKVWKSATAASTPFIITDQNYDEVIDEWSRFNRTEGNPQGGYLRLVGGVSGGQIAVIKAITKAVQADASRIEFAGNPEGKLMIEVEYYYDTGSKPLSNWKAIKPHRANSWYRKPVEGAYVVCVQKTLRWASTTPALMTVKEILEDQDFLDFNHTTLPPLIAATANISGISNPVKVPCLFYMFDIPENNEAAAGRPWHAVAYTSNTANLQWVNSNPVNAKPFGPRNTSNEDVMVSGIRAVLPGQSLFLDDWNQFHIQSGEIHCGSAAEREAEANWWAK